MQKKQSNFKNAFSCAYITKQQSLHHTQRYALLQKKWQNVHGNVIHIANLLNSNKDKKL